jgi:lipoprotein-anchoring transpeptidase ErfK/SrfK
MLYVKSAKYQKAIAVSTGKATTKETTTPNGTFTMDKTSRGWSCSTQYPETCKTQTAGRFANLVTSGSKRTNFGNMYNKRHVVNGVYVHGSMNVPTYPGSAGCIRITPADSDWMYDNVNAMPIIITGKY